MAGRHARNLADYRPVLAGAAIPPPGRVITPAHLPERMPTIIVNGAPKEVPGSLTIDALLRRLGRDPDVPGVAVALRDSVVRRAEWADTVVDDGDRVEIVTAAQGG